MELGSGSPMELGISEKSLGNTEIMYFKLHIFLEWRSYILFLQTGLGWKGMKLCLEDFSSSGPFKLLAAACWKIHFLIAWWTCFRVVFYCNFFKIFTHSYVYVDIFNCLYESTQSQASWLGHLWGGRGVDKIQMKQKRVAREQRNKHKPKTETGTTPSNQTRRQAGGFFGPD